MRLGSKFNNYFSQNHSCYLFDNGCVTVDQGKNCETLQGLSRVWETVPEALVVFLTLDLLALVELMHTAEIVHGGIAPETLFMDDRFYNDSVCPSSDGLVKLMDFTYSLDLKLQSDVIKFMKFPTVQSLSNKELLLECTNAYQERVFNTVGHEYLLGTLRAFGFGMHFVTWIQLLCTAVESLMIPLRFGRTLRGLGLEVVLSAYANNTLLRLADPAGLRRIHECQSSNLWCPLQLEQLFGTSGQSVADGPPAGGAAVLQVEYRSPLLPGSPAAVKIVVTLLLIYGHPVQAGAVKSASRLVTLLLGLAKMAINGSRQWAEEGLVIPDCLSAAVRTGYGRAQVSQEKEHAVLAGTFEAFQDHWALR
eukprot:g45551.t1